MLRRYQLTMGVAARVSDLLIIASVWITSFALRVEVPVLEVTKGFPSFSSYAALTPLIVILWALVLDTQGVYKVQRLSVPQSETVNLVRAHCLALLSFIALTYVFSEYRYSRGVVIYFGVLGAVALVVGWFFVRVFFRLLRRRGLHARGVL